MAITQLWTELYRPKIIDDYVFRDEAQRRQVTTWVKEKTIPHLLFSGAAGTGKCLIGSELIDVQIDTKTLSTKQLIKLANSNNSTPGVGSFVYFQLPIKSLFEILNIDTVEYDTAISTIHTVLINSVTAFVPVNQFVKKQHECACYSLENGESISCSVDHLVFDQGVARKIKECHAIDTINGSVQIVNEYLLGIQDVYDVALNYPHQYVTPNGVIHHNTTLAKVLINEIGIEDYDVLEINASRDNNVDTVRDKIINFVQMIPFGPFKVVLLDECDAMSISAQSILRGVMETYASSSRFILTCVTGDTTIYTQYGTKQIQYIVPGESVISVNTNLENKALIKNIAPVILKIKTKHNYQLSMTPNHELLTMGGPVHAADLTVGSSLLINIKGMIGNTFEYSNAHADMFEVNKFRDWLKTQGVLQESEVAFLKKYSFLCFGPKYKLIYDHLVTNNISNICIPEIAKLLNLPRTSVRNLIKLLEQYVIDKRYVSQDRFEFCIDLKQLIIDYDAHSNYTTSLGCQARSKLSILRSACTVEKIVGQLKIKQFSDDHILSMGRLIGFFEGDGHLSSVIHCAANNKETLERIHKDILKFVDLPFKVKMNGINTNGLCTNYSSQCLKYLLAYFGATTGNKTKQVRKLPSFTKNRLFAKGYIQGFYDADGKSFSVKQDLTVTPILLTQNIYDDTQIALFDEIVDLLKNEFDIPTVASIVIEKSPSTFRGSTKSMHLYNGEQKYISKFIETFGHYYDKTVDPAIVPYVRYKSQTDGYNFLRFSEWKEKYYGFGMLNDTIESIETVIEETPVFDCSFDTNHWYLTNGFVSHNCNYPNKVIPALHSRCQGFHVEKTDQVEFTARVATILITENVEFDLDTLDTYVKLTYPDLRKCINTVQQNVSDLKLMSPTAGVASTSDYKVSMVSLFKAGKIQEARKLLCSQARPEEIEEIFTWMYQNLDLFGKDEEQKDSAVLIIKQGLCDHTICGDPEINLSATLIKLARNMRES